MAYISKGYNFDGIRIILYNTIIFFIYLDLQEDIIKNPNAYKLLSEFRSETK